MSKNPVHIYRALLRECTYLPDPNSTRFIKGWVSDSFRRYLPRERGTTRCRPIKITPERETNILRKGRHLVYTLRRANEGYPTPFEKVLRWTYGRLGKRRRVMMANLAGQEPNSEEFPEPGKEIPKKFSKQWKAPLMVRALLRQQSQHRRYLAWENRKVILAGPTLPEKNLWGKPMPECRVRNKWKKWYAIHLDQIFPPLADGEFQEIKAVAAGVKRWDNSKTRRPTSSVLVHSSPEPEFQSLLSEPKSKPRWPERPHNLTQRFLRRRMAKLLAHTPLARASSKPSAPPVVLKWDRAPKSRIAVEKPNEMEAHALFG